MHAAQYSNERARAQWQMARLILHSKPYAQARSNWNWIFGSKYKQNRIKSERTQGSFLGYFYWDTDCQLEVSCDLNNFPVFFVVGWIVCRLLKISLSLGWDVTVRNSTLNILAHSLCLLLSFFKEEKKKNPLLNSSVVLKYAEIRWRELSVS